MKNTVHDHVLALLHDLGAEIYEPQPGFWDGKKPCWEINHCPELIRDDCPAFRDRALPCWAVEGTYCKRADYGARGDDTSVCQVCRVYRRWGCGQPIEVEKRAVAERS